MHPAPPTENQLIAEESFLTIGGSIVASLFSHVFCCGLLPMTLNASANAFLSGIGMQIGFAAITITLIAATVTWFESHRHYTTCLNKECSCTPDFPARKHFLFNLCIGAMSYAFFAVLIRVPFIHHLMESWIGI